jgi:hypothetical protein
MRNMTGLRFAAVVAGLLPGLYTAPQVAGAQDVLGRAKRAIEEAVRKAREEQQPQTRSQEPSLP